jgi:hypothetical protein
MRSAATILCLLLSLPLTGCLNEEGDELVQGEAGDGARGGKVRLPEEGTAKDAGPDRASDPGTREAILQSNEAILEKLDAITAEMRKTNAILEDMARTEKEFNLDGIKRKYVERLRSSLEKWKNHNSKELTGVPDEDGWFQDQIDEVEELVAIIQATTSREELALHVKWIYGLVDQLEDDLDD